MSGIISIPGNDRRQRYTATAGQTVFSFDFPIYNASDLSVVRLRAGVEEVLGFPAAYSVTGAGTQPGGTITLTVPALAGDIIVVQSNQPTERTTQFVNGGDFLARVLESEFNRLVISLQQIIRQVDRTLRVPDSDAALPQLPPANVRASQYLAFDSVGGFTPALPPGSAAITPFMQTVLAAANQGAAQALLNVRINNSITNLREFGVVGDGVADDTAAFTAAFNAGRRYIEDTQGGVYRITAALPTLGAGRRLIGHGRFNTILRPVGSFQLLTFTGAGCGLDHLQISGTLHTGGGSVRLQNAQQFTSRSITCGSPFNMLYTEQVNQATFEDWWAGDCRGQFSCRFFGQGIGTSGGGVLRSDVIALNNFIASANATDAPIGIDWNGNVHTLLLNNASFLAGHSYGMRVRNTPAGTPPALLECTQANFEYCQNGVYIEAGSSFEFTNLYSLGHTIGDGVFAGPLINNSNVRITNGYIGGNAGWGVRTTGLLMLTNVHLLLNTLGDTSGPVGSLSQRHYFDTSGYIGMTAGNPGVVWDGNDFETFDRTANRAARFIGAALMQGWQAQYSDFGVPVLMASYTSGTRPAATGVPRGLAWQTDTARGARLIYSDGSVWRYVEDSAAV